MKNTMKRLHARLMLLAFSLFAFAAACSSDDSPTGATELKISENILNNGMTFAKSGGTQTLNIQSPTEPQVTSSQPEWCTVSKKESQSKTIYKYSVTTQPNSTTEDRTATIRIEAGAYNQSFEITQTAADGLIIESEKNPSVSADGGELVVRLTTNGNVSVNIDAAATSWIKQVIETRAAMEEKSLRFNISPNYGAERTGIITVTLGELSESITVTQAQNSLPDAGMESDAQTLATKIFAGINIGNTLEAPDGETAWGNPSVSKSYVDGLKALGFNAVRIPCAWDSHIIDQTTNEIDPAWLERVNEVVGYCVSNEMYAIVNIHWDGGWLENNVANGYDSQIDDKQRTLWTQIANKLNSYDEHLLFAGCNEPGSEDMGTAGLDALTRYEQTFIDAVRATGGNNALRCLIVQGPYTNIDRTVNDYTLPTDNVSDRLMVEIHYYDPYQFCLMEADADWGKTFWYWGADNHVAGSEHNPTWGEETYVQEQFAKLKTAFVDRGIPVVMGEYSATKRTINENTADNQELHNQSRAYWNEVVTREAKNYGCIPFYWETGTDVDRYTGASKEAYAIEGIMKGASAGNYPY